MERVVPNAFFPVRPRAFQGRPSQASWGQAAPPITKAGWNSPSVDEDWFHGFSQEIEDFTGAIRKDREPRSGIDLAVDCVEVIYAAYQAAEEGRRISM